MWEMGKKPHKHAGLWVLTCNMEVIMRDLIDNGKRPRNEGHESTL